MRELEKAKAQLVADSESPTELVELRQRVAELRVAGPERKWAEEGLHCLNEDLLMGREKLEDIIRGIGAGLSLLDSETRIVWANRILQDWFGPIEKNRGRLSHELYELKDPQEECSALRTLGSGQTERGEAFAYDIQNQKRYFQIVTVPLKKDGRIVQIVELALDITERKRAEEEIRRRAAQLEALNTVITAAAVAADLPELLETALNHTLVALGSELGSIWVPPHATTHGLPPELHGVMTQTAADAGLDVAGPDVVEDWQRVPANSPLSAIRPVMSRFGIRASLTVPLLSGSRRIGGLSVAAPEPRAWSAEEVALLAAIGRELGAAVVRLRLVEETREQALQIQQIISAAPEGMLLLDRDLRTLVINSAARKHLNALANARCGEALTHLGGRPTAELLAPPSRPGAWHEVTTDGPSPQTFELIARPIRAGTEITSWAVVLRDVTEARRSENQMRRQERLAAIGQLAGGVAHDFNNMLMAIRGYTNLVLTGLTSNDPHHWPSQDEMRADLGEITTAADRAAVLTRQLLAFSRKQVLQPRLLDLNALVANFEKMFRRLIRKDIQLTTALAPSLGQVEADPGQIEQVIMNLAVNARDAMPQGGQLTLETANVVLDEAYARTHPEVQPGRYLMLAVSDTGTGMDAETKSHLFEPFFTTKEMGKGTGLGLATVYGIVKQSGGDIDVYSKPGVGTTFKVYLPRVDKEVRLTGQERDLDSPCQGQEAILLVEGDDMVRNLARRALEQYGYIVLAAPGPGEAVHLSQQHDGLISLLIMDVVLLEMSGWDLAERLGSSRPGMKVLYVSDYADDAIVDHGVLDPRVALLKKPFAPADLARKVREALAAPSLGEMRSYWHGDLAD